MRAEYRDGGAIDRWTDSREHERLRREADYLFRTVDTLEPPDLFAGEDWSEPLGLPTDKPLFVSEAVKEELLRTVSRRGRDTRTWNW